MIRKNSYLCRENKDYLESTDYKETYVDDHTGGKTRVTRYRDGTSTFHYGGPCGKVNYDQYGEEC